VRTVLRKTMIIALCGAARRLAVIFHRGPRTEMSLRPLNYRFYSRSIIKTFQDIPIWWRLIVKCSVLVLYTMHNHSRLLTYLLKSIQEAKGIWQRLHQIIPCTRHTAYIACATADLSHVTDRLTDRRHEQTEHR